MTLEEFNQLKSEVDCRRREADRAKGALSQLESQLKKDYGIKPEELDKTIKKLEEEVEEQSIRYENSLNEWKEAWAEKISSTN